MKSLAFLVIGLLLFSCSEGKKEVVIDYNTSKDSGANNESGFKVSIVEYGPDQYGYQILENGKLLIDQQHIPAVQGLIKFKSREEALRLGNHVKDLIEKGIMPPTVSINDLDSLYISY